MSSWFKNKKQDSGEDSTVLDAMRHARKKIADLEEELARYKNLEVKVKKTETQLDQAHAEVARTAPRADNAEKELRAKKEELGEALRRIKELEAQLADRECQLAKLDPIMEASAKRLTELEEELSRLRKQLDEERAARQAAEKMLAAASGGVEQLNALQSQLNALQKEYGRLKEQYDSLKAKYDKLKRDYDELKAKYDRLQHEHDSLLAEHDKLKAAHAAVIAENAQLKRENAMLQKDLDRANKLLGAANANAADAEEMGRLREELSKLRRMLGLAEEHGEKLAGQVSSASAQVERLQAELAAERARRLAAEELAEEAEELREKGVADRARIRSLKQELDALKQRMKQLEAELASYRGNVEDREALMAEASRVRKALARMWQELCLYVDEAAVTKSLGDPTRVNSEEVVRLHRGWDKAIKESEDRAKRVASEQLKMGAELSRLKELLAAAQQESVQLRRSWQTSEKARETQTRVTEKLIARNGELESIVTRAQKRVWELEGYVDMSDREAVYSLQESLRDASPLHCPVTTQQYNEALHARYSGFRGASRSAIRQHSPPRSRSPQGVREVRQANVAHHTSDDSIDGMRVIGDEEFVTAVTDAMNLRTEIRQHYEAVANQPTGQHPAWTPRETRARVQHVLRQSSPTRQRGSFTPVI